MDNTQKQDANALNEENTVADAAARAENDNSGNPSAETGEEAGVTGADVAQAYEAAGDAEREIQDMREQMLRYAAECENVRRRSERDVAAARDYAIEGFAKDMAEVLENLIRALESGNAGSEGESAAAVLEGVEMTRREMINAFERHHIKRVSPLGEKFDHNLHQAVASKPAPDGQEPGTVLEVYQSGYVIKDRLLKPAIVVVAAAE